MQAEVDQAIDNLHLLLDQQEYEFQRLIASFQLKVREIENLLNHKKLTTEVASELGQMAGNMKHLIRDGRTSLEEAERYMEGLFGRVCSLEPR